MFGAPSELGAGTGSQGSGQAAPAAGQGGDRASSSSPFARCLHFSRYPGGGAGLGLKRSAVHACVSPPHALPPSRESTEHRPRGRARGQGLWAEWAGPAHRTGRAAVSAPPGHAKDTGNHPRNTGKFQNARRTSRDTHSTPTRKTREVSSEEQSRKQRSPRGQDAQGVQTLHFLPERPVAWAAPADRTPAVALGAGAGAPSAHIRSEQVEQLLAGQARKLGGSGDVPPEPRVTVQPPHPVQPGAGHSGPSVDPAEAERTLGRRGDFE